MTTTLVNLYDALTAAGAPQDKARAAVQSVEESQDEPWKRKMEADNADIHTEIREMKVMLRIVIVMLLPLLIKAFFWN